ncbi:hypothetical protein QBC44DRAFT_334388 [Cladorrhinum sp. PSN332]|nr:hypothetical protein QBC44DRAFT_334388 [Cladorrhinum sp. PSN332]
MSLLDYRLARAALSLAFIVLPAYYMLLPTFHQFTSQISLQVPQTYVASGKIGWQEKDGAPKSIPLLQNYFGIKYFDEQFLLASVAFSPSSNGYDPISRWQFLQFLMDLGPLYVVWLLEGWRRGNRWTPAYLPSVGLFIAQLVTLGLAAPAWYFFQFTFGTSAKGMTKHQRTVQREYVPALLFLVLGLHIGVIALAYFSPDHSARNWWVWAWQPVPLWIGMANVVLSNTVLRLPGFRGLKNHWFFSAATLSVLVGAISFGSWALVWTKAPYSLREILAPAVPLAQTKDIVLLCRELLQLDYLASFWGTFAWMVCLFLDMYAGGIITGVEFATEVVLIPIFCLFGGPGVALLNGWWWREKKLAVVDKKTPKDRR